MSGGKNCVTVRFLDRCPFTRLFTLWSNSNTFEFIGVHLWESVAWPFSDLLHAPLGLKGSAGISLWAWEVSGAAASTPPSGHLQAPTLIPRLLFTPVRSGWESRQIHLHENGFKGAISASSIKLKTNYGY